MSTYIERITELVAGRDPAAVLAELDEKLDTLLEELSDDELRRPETPERWSILQVVHHLADAELVYGYRLRLTLTLDTPQFEHFDQDQWAVRFRYDQTPLSEGRARLTSLRREHLRIIETIEPSDRDRAGIHPSRGAETVDRLLTMWAGHDLAHRRQIQRIREAHAAGGAR